MSPEGLCVCFFSVSDLNLSEQNILQLELIFFGNGADYLAGHPRSDDTGGNVMRDNACALSMCREPTATSCSPSAPICSTVDANFLAMVPVAKIPRYLPFYGFGSSIPWFSPTEKIVKNKNAPGGLVPTLRGQILCTGIFHLVPNILIHYNRDRKKVPT